MKVRLTEEVSAYFVLVVGISALGAQGTAPESSASPATHLSVTAPSPVTEGVAFEFTVKALDASNNVVTGYRGTVHFTSNDSKAVLPANSKLKSGAGSFSAKLNTAGTHTIRVTDTLTSSITGISKGIRVNVVASISIAPQNLTIFLNSSQPFDAVATFSDRSVQDVTKTARWLSSEPSTASVSSAGVVTGLKAGTASISAAIGPVKSSTSVTISSSTSGVTLVDDFTDSRLMRYQPGDGSLVTYAGNRNKNGLAAAVTSVLETTSDGKTQSITFDSEGRINQMNTSDGSQLSIDWSSPSKPVLTTISADRTSIAAVVIPANNASTGANSGIAAQRSLRNKAQPADSSSSAIQTVRVASCKGAIPEDGAHVYVTKSGVGGGGPIPANLLGNGVYGVYLPSGPTGEPDAQLSQGMQNALSNICGSDPTAPTLSLEACNEYPPGWAQLACTLAVGAYKAVCVGASAINGTQAVLTYINNKSPSVDVIADVTLNGQTERQTLSNQPPQGPYPSFEFTDFACLQIDHVKVSPGSAAIDLGQYQPLEATAVDENSKIITSSALKWTWSPSDGFVQIVPSESPAGGGLATVIGKQETPTGTPDTVTATAEYSGQSSKSGSSEISVGCSASGTWQGTYEGSDGSSGSEIASFSQTGKSIAGTVSIVESDGEEYQSNVTGTDDSGNVSFGPIAFGDIVISATGTFSSSCGVLSGNFLLNGTNTVVGTYMATKQ